MKCEETKDVNLKKNMSLIFESTIQGLGAVKSKEEPLVEDSKSTSKRFSPIWRQVRDFNQF
jgi:hypothetical protein